MRYNDRNKKYRIVNAKMNKQLINDELTLQPIKIDGDGDPCKRKKVKQPSLRTLVLEIQSTLNRVIDLNNLKH
jgi:hypothetical protein